MKKGQQIKRIEKQRKSWQKDALDYQQPNRISTHIDHIYKLKHGLYCPPIMVEVSPTSICQQECRFCYTYQREHTNMLDDKVMFDFFSNASGMGIDTIYICGTGEPLVNKSLPDAVVAGGKTDIKIGLNTNGALFDKQKQIKIKNIHNLLQVCLESKLYYQ